MPPRGTSFPDVHGARAYLWAVWPVVVAGLATGVDCSAVTVDFELWAVWKLQSAKAAPANPTTPAATIRAVRAFFIDPISPSRFEVGDYSPAAPARQSTAFCQQPGDSRRSPGPLVRGRQKDDANLAGGLGRGGR